LGDKCPWSKYFSTTINKIESESRRQHRERKRDQEDSDTRARTFTRVTRVEFSTTIEIEHGTPTHLISPPNARAFKKIGSKEMFFFSSIPLSFLLQRMRVADDHGTCGRLNSQSMKRDVVDASRRRLQRLLRALPTARTSARNLWFDRPLTFTNIIIFFILPTRFRYCNTDLSIILTVQINKMK